MKKVYKLSDVFKTQLYLSDDYLTATTEKRKELDQLAKDLSEHFDNYVAVFDDEKRGFYTVNMNEMQISIEDLEIALNYLDSPGFKGTISNIENSIYRIADKANEMILNAYL